MILWSIAPKAYISIVIIPLFLASQTLNVS